MTWKLPSLRTRRLPRPTPESAAGFSVFSADWVWGGAGVWDCEAGGAAWAEVGVCANNARGASASEPRRAKRWDRWSMEERIPVPTGFCEYNTCTHFLCRRERRFCLGPSLARFQNGNLPVVSTPHVFR